MKLKIGILLVGIFINCTNLVLATCDPPENPMEFLNELYYLAQTGGTYKYKEGIPEADFTIGTLIIQRRSDRKPGPFDIITKGYDRNCDVHYLTNEGQIQYFQNNKVTKKQILTLFGKPHNEYLPNPIVMDGRYKDKGILTYQTSGYYFSILYERENIITTYVSTYEGLKGLYQDIFMWDTIK